LKEKNKERQEEKDIAAVASDCDVVFAFDEAYANLAYD
jgi:aspartate/methionine/tyrosine aminotransferase